MIDKVDTHGFAVWIPKVLRKYPWTSCDAATWRLLAAYGKIYYPLRGYKNPDFTKQPHHLAVSERHSKEGSKELKPHYIKMLKEDGFDIEKLQTEWGERAKANVRYFLEFEKWLNEDRKDKEFKPRNRIM
jgi:hypothetical protein